jgi:spore coat-associated protein N
MKKILGLTVAAMMVMGLVGGGTWAYFSDTETSTTNLFTAGTLDLTVDDGNVNLNMLVPTDIAPGDDDGGTPGTLNLKNIGSITADLTVATTAANNTESTGPTEFEADGDAGELGGYVQISVWIDVDTDGTYDDGTDIRLDSDGTAYTSGALEFDTIDNHASTTWTDCYTGMATFSTTEDVDLMVEWQFPDSGDQNDAQGDEVSIGFTFTLNPQ